MAREFSIGRAVKQLFGLSGRVALVTGGASGIGLAAARALSAAGAQVVIADRALLSAELLAGIEGPHETLALTADIAQEAEVERIIAAVIDRHARLDILVNSAGIAIRDAAVNLGLEAWEKVLAVNLTGSFLCARIAARAMIAGERGGSIVNLASIMGLSGGGLYPNVSYQASKGAIVNMTRALAVEWAPHGIRVNAVAPTYVRTPFIAPLLAQPDLVRRIEELTPLRRLADPEEVAAAILFLSGPGAAMVTGHTLPVDGGFLAQ